MSRIFRITETYHPYCDEDDIPPAEVAVFFVDEDKWDASVNGDNSFQCGYVSRIVDAAKAGHLTYFASKKYSFSDTPDWWDFLAPINSSGHFDAEIAVQLND